MFRPVFDPGLGERLGGDSDAGLDALILMPPQFAVASSLIMIVQIPATRSSAIS